MPSTPKTSFRFRLNRLNTMRRFTAIVATIAAGFTVAGAAGQPASARDLFKQDAFIDYKPDVANGEYMMNASGCAACHAPGSDLKLLSGGTKMDTFIGTFYVPNISASPQGVGGWSKADFLNAVINGVGKDGRHLYPVMPYTSYAGMKPQDVLDIQAYIESLPKSDNAVPRHELSLPYSLNFTIAFWKRRNFTTAAFQPGKDGQLERGRYLVENAGACGDCHTPRTIDFGLDNERKFQGEKGLTGSTAGNITAAVISSLSQEAFTKSVLTEGNKLSGSPISDPIMKKFVHGLGELNDEDKLAIYAYLTGSEVEAPKIAETPKEACTEAGSAQAALTSVGSTPQLASKADAFIGKYCRNCHGPGESAQGSFPSGSLSSIAANAAFVTPGDRNKSLLYESVASGRMPMGQRPSATELEELGQWIDSLNETQVVATTATSGPPPRQRPILAWRNFAETAIRDIGELSANDRPFIRYFSYRTQFNGKLPCEDEDKYAKRQELYQAGFHKLLNSVSRGTSLVVPDKVEGTKDLLVRVDIRDLGWDSDTWDKLVDNYPFGYDPASDSVLKSLSAETSTDLPIMRVDWFMANALRPENYHSLLDLPEKISELEKRFGIDVDDNIKRRRVMRGAFFEGASGVSDHNRMVERHDMPRGGYYWKSYDFAGSRDDQSLKLHPHGPTDIEPLDEDLTSFHHDGGEMIFTLANGMQGFYLSLANGDRLDRGPTSIVSFRQRPIGKGVDIVNARSCFTCHFDGTIAKRDQMRDYIESSPTFNLAQRDLLLEMYVKQDELDAAFAEDRERFVTALSQIGATEKAPNGGLTSRKAPGQEEIITWFADLYEAELDFEALAAEFDMTPEEFEQAVQRVDDSATLKISLDWITQLKGGGKVPRFEVEQQFAKLVEPLLGVEPLESDSEGATTNETKDAKDDKDKDPETPDYKDPDLRDDAYKGDDAKKGKLKLAVDVKNTDVFVDEKLSFDVTANEACELQIFYVEADGNVEIIPQVMIGEAFLEAGKARRIPDPATGDLVFDTAAEDETLLLFCRVGGLGNQKMSAEDARKLVKKSNQPAARGLAIKLIEKNKVAEKKEPKLKGVSAFNMVTFNVQARK